MKTPTAFYVSVVAAMLGFIGLDQFLQRPVLTTGIALGIGVAFIVLRRLIPWNDVTQGITVGTFVTGLAIVPILLFPNHLLMALPVWMALWMGGLVVLQRWWERREARRSAA